jgi:hypothetical protein
MTTDRGGATDTNPVGRGRYTPGRARRPARARLDATVHEAAVDSDRCQWQHISRSRGELLNPPMLPRAYTRACGEWSLSSRQTTWTLRIAPSARAPGRQDAPHASRPTRRPPGSSCKGTWRSGASSVPPRTALALESRRNRAQLITLWTWSRSSAHSPCGPGSRASAPTPRHLCLTDLARSGWSSMRSQALLGTAMWPPPSSTFICQAEISPRSSRARPRPRLAPGRPGGPVRR